MIQAAAHHYHWLNLKMAYPCYTVTPEGVFTGQQICYGGKAPAEIGNIIPLGKVPEGTISLRS